MGIRNGGLETFQIEMLNYSAGDGTQIQSFLYTKNDIGYCMYHISIKYGFRGPTQTVSACALQNDHRCI
jgi:3-oxoacyl-[acyl-carrier-protein] synthase II